jgi:diacylglycerol kinase (ATP)
LPATPRFFRLTGVQPVGQHANPVADASLISSFLPAVVFMNLAAGGGRARSSIAQIQSVFQSASVPAEFITIGSTNDLESGASAAIQGGKRLLITLGGDGTFQALVNAAYRADVLLGVLPAGGGNDFAAALHVPQNPVAAADAILRGQPKAVDLARARTADGRVRLYLGGGGIGIDAEAARYASGVFRRWPGRSRYIASALRALVGYRPLQVRVDFPRKDLPALAANSLLAAVLNTPTYGGGIQIAPDARLDDGQLDIRILVLLPRLWASGELRTPRIKRFRVQSVRLSPGRPCAFHADGEILGPTPVEIEVVPNAVRILAPHSQEREEVIPYLPPVSPFSSRFSNLG